MGHARANGGRAKTTLGRATQSSRRLDWRTVEIGVLGGGHGMDCFMAFCMCLLLCRKCLQHSAYSCFPGSLFLLCCLVGGCVSRTVVCPFWGDGFPYEFPDVEKGIKRLTYLVPFRTRLGSVTHSPHRSCRRTLPASQRRTVAKTRPVVSSLTR